MIPTVSKILTGDKSKAAHYLGLAKRQLNILLNQMSLAKPKPLKISHRKLNLKYGGYILVEVCYNARTIRIHIPSDLAKELEEHTLKECVCNCNFTVGQIISIQEDKIGLSKLYTVRVCTNKKYYMLHENILASDYTEYLAGQVVIMIPYNDALYQCCSSNSQTVTGCNPSKSEELITNDAWRSALKIIPWCVSSIPPWINIRKVYHG